MLSPLAVLKHPGAARPFKPHLFPPLKRLTRGSPPHSQERSLSEQRFVYHCKNCGMQDWAGRPRRPARKPGDPAMTGPGPLSNL
jgi:hypothetical protein